MSFSSTYPTTSAKLGDSVDAGQFVRLTKAQEIQNVLADDIIHGRLPPGTALDETIFATRLGVSRTPIREAIRQLEAIGLVETRPHRGAVVTDIPAGKLDDMLAVLAEYEAVCARWSAQAMTDEERRRLRDIWRDSKNLMSEAKRSDYIEANTAFHEAIYEGSHSPCLAEQTRALKLRLAPFRDLKFQSPDWMPRSFAEHDRVSAAIERGDAEEAYNAMLQHLGTVRDIVYRIARGIGGNAESEAGTAGRKSA